jgi:hypothetical protein
LRVLGAQQFLARLPECHTARSDALHPAAFIAILASFVANSASNAATVMFTNALTISETNASYDGQDLIINNATVTINGAHSFNSLLLTNNAVLHIAFAPGLISAAAPVPSVCARILQG